MKKIFVLFILLATLLTLVGCNAEEERSTRRRSSSVTETEETTAPVTSGLSSEEVLDSFDGLLEPIADQFQVTLLQKVALDGEDICQPVVITDTLLGNSYHLHIYYTPAGGVYTLTLNAKQGERTDINFALLSSYLYKSLNLPEMETQDFYDHFKLLTEEPSGMMTVEGWSLLASSGAELLVFGASYE